MSKNFHRDYAESVGHFCQSLPPDRNVTAQEVDTYFRACTLCLWAASGGRGGDVIGINQLYTDRQVKFSPEQFEKAISFYRNNPNYTVGVPEFFQRMVQADAASGDTYSRTFAEVQKNLLMLSAAYDGSFSFAESRRITLLYGQLTDACDKAGVPPIPLTPGPDQYLPEDPASRLDAGKELNDPMDEFSKVINRDRTRGVFDDFFGAPSKPVPGDPMSPLPVTGGGEPENPAENTASSPGGEEKPPEGAPPPPPPGGPPARGRGRARGQGEK